MGLFRYDFKNLKDLKIHLPLVIYCWSNITLSERRPLLLKETSPCEKLATDIKGKVLHACHIVQECAGHLVLVLVSMPVANKKNVSLENEAMFHEENAQCHSLFSNAK